MSLKPARLAKLVKISVNLENIFNLMLATFVFALLFTLKASRQACLSHFVLVLYFQVRLHSTMLHSLKVFDPRQKPSFNLFQ
jgi:hypothetical protein